MKEIKLTQGKVALVDDSDYEFLNQWKWYAQFNKGSKYYYAVRSVSKGRKKISMHRLILNINDTKLSGDHKDHNTLNNQRSNLRIATYSQNKANTKSHKDSSSKFLGVSIASTKKIGWLAHIGINNKNKHLGCFDNEIDAALAYNKAAKELHGEFANLNKVAS